MNALSSILSPLGAYNGQASIQADTLVLTGLANRPARPDGPGDHASGTGAFITNAHPFKTNGANISNGISFDQVLANAWRGRTRYASLELGQDGGSTSGDCDSGYSCAYARNIAWASATQRETSPPSTRRTSGSWATTGCSSARQPRRRRPPPGVQVYAGGSFATKAASSPLTVSPASNLPWRILSIR